MQSLNVAQVPNPTPKTCREWQDKVELMSEQNKKQISTEDQDSPESIRERGKEYFTEEGRKREKEQPDFLSDKLFKFIFGRPERVELTLAFLNDLFRASGSPLIESLTFDNPVLPADSPSAKQGTIDIVATTEDGVKVHIEVQVKFQNFYAERAVYYVCALHNRRFSAGDDYDAINRTVSVNITNFTLLEGDFGCHDWFFMVSPRTHRRLSDRVMVHTLELSKLTKGRKYTELSPVERWLVLLSRKYTLEEKKEMAQANAYAQKMFEAADVFMSDDANYMAYVRDMLARQEEKMAIRENTEEIARRMKKLGCDDQLISEATGLSLERIKQLDAGSGEDS